jgi:hypothetical protein
MSLFSGTTKYNYPDGGYAWVSIPSGKLHRADGPAVEWPNGTKEWWFDGKPHRTDGPAIVLPTGYKAWYLHGKYHRVDGPAIEWPNGVKNWYLNDAQTTPEYISALCAVRKFRDRVRKFNSVLGFNLMHLLKLSRTKAVIEWYYSPENGGGKLAKKRIERMFPDRM